MNKSKRYPLSPLFAALLAGVALAACDSRDEAATSGAAGHDAVVAQSDPARTDAGAMPNQRSAPATGDATVRDAPATTTPGTNDARAAGDTVGNKVDDAVITTKVNAELAQDDQLSALKIDVDTSNGRVVLHGTAPNEAARERAGELAAGVTGVVAVDNALTLEQK